MLLKSFGCSFIYGSDLKDCPHGVNEMNPPPSRLSWPALLANHFGLEYQCLARPGASNLQIMEALLSSVTDQDDHLYVVNWTWIERFGYTSEQAKKINGTGTWNPLGWCSILPSDQDEVARTYYRHIHSQFRDKLETLICLRTAIDVLRDRGIKFLMTYTDSLVFENEWHTSPAIAGLQKDIGPLLTRFDGMSFWDWTQTNNFATSEKWHPLEEAHADAARLMCPVIDAILHKA